MKENNESWAKRNPQKHREYKMKSYLKRKSLGYIDRKAWREKKERYGNICFCCLKPNLKLEMDHKIPVFAGGTNDIINLQPLCESCHSKKHFKYIDYEKENKKKLEQLKVIEPEITESLTNKIIREFLSQRGRKGHLVFMKNTTPEQRSKMAKNAVNARIKKYGQNRIAP